MENLTPFEKSTSFANRLAQCFALANAFDTLEKAKEDSNLSPQAQLELKLAEELLIQSLQEVVGDRVIEA